MTITTTVHRLRNLLTILIDDGFRIWDADHWVRNDHLYVPWGFSREAMLTRDNIDSVTAEQARAIFHSIAQAQKILAIKAYRMETGAGLREAKEAVDALCANVHSWEFAGDWHRIDSIVRRGNMFEVTFTQEGQQVTLLVGKAPSMDAQVQVVFS